MPFGAESRADGTVRFRLWAPAAEVVRLELPGRQESFNMQPLQRGWHEVIIPAKAGEVYQFVLPDGLRVADPASRCQEHEADGPSLVVDPSAYRWRHESWRGRPWHEAVVHELHVGTFTPAGTFAGAAERLPYLAQLGVTAIELMPIAHFPGKWNWGYDGVLAFAPDPTYGTPDELKALVDAAHGYGLMVFLDVVYNHFGPAGNSLRRYAPEFFTADCRTPWGEAIDFRRPEVRAFYIANALYWLEEFRLDGLRFDAVHAIVDPSETHFLVELAHTVRTTVGRDVHLVLENDQNRASFLRHDPKLGRRLFDAQWNDDLHHTMHVLLTGERHGYYADFADAPVERLRRALAEGFVYQGEPAAYDGGTPRGEPSGDLPPLAFASFLQNHDQIGNRALGERLSLLAPPEAVQACQAIVLLGPQVPLLFMGEEWAARTPFLFFCDFEGDLAQAVREGRRHEFAAFFDQVEEIPDPLDEATFVRSHLDWLELDHPEHAGWLARTRRLLRLRAQEIAPRLGDTVRVAHSQALGSRGLLVSWRLSDGSRLTLLANLGDVSIASPGIPAGNVLHSTHADLAGDLPPWSVTWVLS
jgi:maltooligosyltrehalose trehalohydrolase